METPASSFKLLANAAEGRKQLPISISDSERLVPQLAASIAAMDNSRHSGGLEQTAPVCA